MREVLEEAGCTINCTGVLRLERSIKHGHARMRVIYHARPGDASRPLKTTPDSESDGARWVDLQVSVAKMLCLAAQTRLMKQLKTESTSKNVNHLLSVYTPFAPFEGEKLFYRDTHATDKHATFIA